MLSVFFITEDKSDDKNGSLFEQLKPVFTNSASILWKCFRIFHCELWREDIGKLKSWNGSIWERLENFKCLGVICNEDNNIQIDLQERIINVNKTYFVLQIFLKNKNISKKLKLRLKNTIIDKTLTYASETWTLTKRDRKQLNIFERKVYRRILGPEYDNEKENWRILTNNEIYASVKKPTIIETIRLTFWRLNYFFKF